MRPRFKTLGNPPLFEVKNKQVIFALMPKFYLLRAQNSQFTETLMQTKACYAQPLYKIRVVAILNRQNRRAPTQMSRVRTLLNLVNYLNYQLTVSHGPFLKKHYVRNKHWKK